MFRSLTGPASWCIMGNWKYQYVFNRLKKLEKTLETLCNENEELGKANSKLRNTVDTMEQQAAARERVLQSFQRSEDAKMAEEGVQVHMGTTPTGIRESNEAVPGREQPGDIR